MELRQYWRILMRRWWVVAVITVATAVFSLLTSPLTAQTYTATVRALVTLQAQLPIGPFYTYDRYYSFLSTEYIVDDIIEVINSGSFRKMVFDEMPGQQPTVAFGLESQPRRERAPRVVTVTVTTTDAGEAQRIGDAVGRALVNRAPQYFNQSGLMGVTVQLIDTPAVTSGNAGGRSYVNLLLRTLAGFLVGLGLAFMLHYLDPRLHDPEEASRLLGLPLLAVIPRGRR